VKIPKVVKQQTDSELALFVDGTSLDRAAKRLNKRLDIPKLIERVSTAKCSFVRYYNTIPSKDDARHIAFMDNLRNHGIEVVMRRLPPIGITKRVAIDIDMATDIIGYTLHHPSFASDWTREDKKRGVIVVCPTEELDRTLEMVTQTGSPLSVADFGRPRSLPYGRDWINLEAFSDIWR